jgi:hypothetical protein
MSVRAKACDNLVRRCAVLGKRMVGALLVLVGMTLFLWGGVTWLIEQTDPVYSSIESRTRGETSPALPIGVALTLAGGVVLLLSPVRQFS